MGSMKSFTSKRRLGHQVTVGADRGYVGAAHQYTNKAKNQRRTSLYVSKAPTSKTHGMWHGDGRMGDLHTTDINISRRHAAMGIGVVGAAGALGFGGYKWHQHRARKEPAGGHHNTKVAR